jgi:glyoxylase-like metal-dependent hydrolase (beta-lactamase superfamily II)
LLNQLTHAVSSHTSEFCQSNAIAVHAAEGVLLIDAGMQNEELATLAGDLRGLGPVVAGFSTHPHWDHLLWHPALGQGPRYSTARCAEAVQQQLSAPDAAARVRTFMPPDIADRIPVDLLGRVTGLPAGTTHIPWSGPRITMLEHRAHAPGHAALLIEDDGVLVVGDMLSDVLIPLLDLQATTDPVEDYLDALQQLATLSDTVDWFVPGHGTAGTGAQFLERIERDRAYVLAAAAGRPFDDPRIGPEAAYDWVRAVHDNQLEQLSRRAERGGLTD